MLLVVTVRGERLLGLVALLATLAAGCSGGNSPTESNSTASTPATAKSAAPSTTASSSAATTPQERAVAAYRAMWVDMSGAATTSDWQSPALGRHATGDALALIVKSLHEDQLAGVVTKGRPILNPRVVEATPSTGPTRVTIADCADATDWLKYEASTGKLKDDVPGGRHAITAVVRNLTGAWLVAQFQVRGVGTC